MAKNLWLVKGDCGAWVLRSTKANAMLAIEEEENGVDCVERIYEVKVKSMSVLERHTTVKLAEVQLKYLELP